MTRLLALAALLATGCSLEGTLAPLAPRDGGAAQGAGSPCEVLVPDEVAILTPVWNVSPVPFYVPHPTWAFAVAHASARFEALALDGLSLRLSPSFLLATALQESFLACDATTAPNPLHPEFTFGHQTSTDAAGCFQLDAGTAWLEICRMFPEAVDCARVTHADAIAASAQGTTGRSNFEPGAMAAAYYDTFAYALLPAHGVPDPDAWFAGAADPLAAAKVVALAYSSGPWSTALAPVLAGCRDRAIEECLTPGSAERDYVTSVAAYTRALEAAAPTSCYDAIVSLSDVDAYLAHLAVLFVHEDWPAIAGRAHAAFLGATGGAASARFQRIARPVLDALAAGMTSTLRCPAAALQASYSRQCPP